MEMLGCSPVGLLYSFLRTYTLCWQYWGVLKDPCELSFG